MQITIEQNVKGPTGTWNRRAQIRRLTGVLDGILLIALFCIPIRSFGTTPLGSYSALLAWVGSPSPAVVSYRIYYGTASGNYTASVTAGNVTSKTITGLASGTTYFFAVTASDTNGLTGAFSNEISYAPGTPTVQMHATGNQQPILKVSGLIGATYDIMATQDLVTWTVIGTVTLDASASANFTDPNAASYSQRFYRIQQAP
jgi:hypothetical protein